MPDIKTSNYKGYTDARKKANAKYISQFVELKVRVEPERRDAIKAHADAAGESVNAYINRAISDRMESEDAQAVDGTA